jgi:hypothetical protein
MNVTEYALSYHSAGLRIIPTTPAKTPIKGFDLAGRFHGPMPSVLQLQQEFTQTEWIGVAGGAVLCIDIDAKAKGPVEEACKEVSDIWKLRGFTPYIESTLSGGRHIVIWVPEPKRCPGSQKIVKRYVAEATSKDKNLAFVETRGVGGYFITFPTAGYGVIEGSLLNKYMGTQEQFEEAYDEMIQVSQKWLVINEENVKSATNVKVFVPKTIAECMESSHVGPPKEKAEKPDYVEVGIFEDFSNKTDPIQLITSFGGTLVTDKEGTTKQTGDFIFFIRPGKCKGTGASFNLQKKYFRVHTSNWGPFQEDTTYSMEGAYCFYHHNGDFKKASQDLKEKGFGKFKDLTAEDVAELIVPDRRGELGVNRKNPYPIDFWPPTLKEMIKNVAYELQMPQPMVGTMMLGAMSVIPARNDCLVNWCGNKLLETLNLWTLYLDNPSAGKTTIFKILKDGILNIEKEARQCFAQRNVENRAEIMRLQKSLADLKKTDSYLEMVHVEDSIKALKDSRPPTIFVNDFTPEKLAELFSVNKCLAVLSAETQFIENILPRYGPNEQMALFLSSWSGDQARIHRKNKDQEEIVIDKPLLTLACLIQPDALMKMLEIKNSRTLGLHSRILWSANYQKQGYRDMSMNPDISEETVKPWQDACIQLNLSKNRILTLSRQASEILCSRAQRMEELKRPGEWGEDFGDVIGKIQKGQTSRIAANLHLLSGNTSDEISGETMNYAADMVLYHLIEAYWVLKYMDDPPTWQRILKWAEGKVVFDMQTCKRNCHCARSIPSFKLKIILDDMTASDNLTYSETSEMYTFRRAQVDVMDIAQRIRGEKP